MKPQIAEINCSTGETTIREMNDEEYNQHLLDVEEVTPTPTLEG